MLYLNYATNKEDFILEEENRFPHFVKRILYMFRKLSGQVLEDYVDGKNIVQISRFNKRTYKKLDKIFKTDVTRNICISEAFYDYQEFIDYLKKKNLHIMDGRWLFRYLINDIAEFICNKLELKPEAQEISLLVDEPDSFIFDTIRKLSTKYKNINIVTNKIRKFEKIENEIFEEKGLILNISNNFKRTCIKSKIVYNIDFPEKMLQKIIFLPSAIIINLEKYMEVKQSNFKGKNIDFYSINLPIKYKKIYDKLNNFNSSVLYESIIYKRTSNQNIWNEIINDKVEILLLEEKNKVVKF